ncbi:hypothetical protein [Nonlabens sp. Asnod3-H03]|uniref:hypothetical protein n=1 Tax=Nonlabens sp. Asnod3-H03 TaxID=3160580 RepID=UPI0005AB1367|nr:hypothetical protein [Nonlabens ulvanivorans]
MKIFNKLRFNIIRARSFRKYLLYAIGEIVLVVAGILIALWLNNKNAQAKIEQDNLKHAQTVLTYMDQHIQELDMVMEQYEAFEPIISKIIYTPTDEPISNCENCNQMLFGFLYPEIDNRAAVRSDMIRSDNDSLSLLSQKITADYNAYSKISDIYIKSAQNVLHENMNYLKDNNSWFTAFISQGECNDDCMTYFNESYDYRNRVTYFNLIVFDAYQFELYQFRDQLKEHREHLQNIIHEIEP